MLRSCAAGIRTVPRPMRCSNARRRAAVAATATGRPIPGSSGTTSYAPIGAADPADFDADWARIVWSAEQAAAATTTSELSLRIRRNLLLLDATRVPERN